MAFKVRKLLNLAKSVRFTLRGIENIRQYTCFCSNWIGCVKGIFEDQFELFLPSLCILNFQSSEVVFCFRLHLQGTRTIIDNLDDGLSVTPILTNFEGVADCYEATVYEEGGAGLYKGFGALILQCITYTSIIKLSKFVFTQVSILFCKNDSSYLAKESYKVNVSPSQPIIQNRKTVRVKQRPKYDLSSDSEGFEESTIARRRNL